jgi:hypothetical protein
MVPALLMFAAASVGFGGHPWVGFAGGALLMIASSTPERLQVLRSYRREPVADIVIAILLEVTLNVAGALASAWTGYGLRLFLMFFLRNP